MAFSTYQMQRLLQRLRSLRFWGEDEPPPVPAEADRVALSRRVLADSRQGRAAGGKTDPKVKTPTLWERRTRHNSRRRAFREDHIRHIPSGNISHYT